VAGEPGIGKSTLVEDFLASLSPDCLVACGRCSERLGGTEAYLPVGDALGDLLRSSAGATVGRLLKAIAPTWYAQVVPAASDGSARAHSQPAMLREFFALLQELTHLGTVVLFLDDVHWADVPTVDLLAHVGRHCAALRVLIVAAYRPTELLLGPHPFAGVRDELQARGVCTELSLGFMSRADVDRYLSLAFPNHAFTTDFAQVIHARTEGNPLFMADLLRYLRERGVIAEARGRWALARELPDLGTEMPESVRGMIRRKLERPTDADRRLLSAAAVQGPEFDSATIAGALSLDAAEVEERLQVLERVHGLVRLIRESEFPGQVPTLRYVFVHVLYQQALDADLSPSRRAALGGALARALEAHQGPRGPEAAAQLAYLYEVGRDHSRASRQCALAANNVARVFAHREAAGLARRGLRLLESLPVSPERDALELPLQTMLGLQLQVTQGYAAPEATRAYTRARDLCGTRHEGLFPILWGLWLAAKVRSELPHARELAGQLQALAAQLNDPDLGLQAQQALAVTTLCLGEPASTVSHMEQGTVLYDPERHRAHSYLFGQDPGVACKAFGSVALWLLGHPDAAARVSEEAVRLGRDLRQPSTLALALHFASVVHQLRRDSARTQACATECDALAAEHHLSFWRAGSAIMSGWALAVSGAADEGLARLRQGLIAWRQTGSVTYRTYFLGLLAELLGSRGQVTEACRILDEALTLARQTTEGLYEAELYRLRGDLSLGDPNGQERAANDFDRARKLANRQGAKSLELRATSSLTRLRIPKARQRLMALYNSFAEGFDTPDLREAHELLDGTEPG
jgi:predicted ATPase